MVYTNIVASFRKEVLLHTDYFCNASYVCLPQISSHPFHPPTGKLFRVKSIKKKVEKFGLSDFEDSNEDDFVVIAAVHDGNY